MIVRIASNLLQTKIRTASWELTAGSLFVASAALENTSFVF
jgi:hypothetical protein